MIPTPRVDPGIGLSLIDTAVLSNQFRRPDVEITPCFSRLSSQPALRKLAPVTEHHDARSFEQGVMVDVGPGAGALVIYTNDDLRGEEIEISPKGDDANRTHTDVLRRKVADGYVNAAVFGSLAEGEYWLWHSLLREPAEVHIAGGEVTELDWR